MCVTAHNTHPMASLLLSESDLQEHTVHTFSCCPSDAVCRICPVFAVSLLLLPCINRPLRTLAWGGEQRWTLHFQKQMQLCETCAVCCLSELADITVSSSSCCPYVSCKYIVSGSLFFTSSTVFCILPLASFLPLKGTIFCNFVLLLFLSHLRST